MQLVQYDQNNYIRAKHTNRLHDQHFWYQLRSQHSAPQGWLLQQFLLC